MSRPVDPEPSVASAAGLQVPGVVAVQRRTVRVLFVSQVLGGIGVGSVAAVGGLLAEDIGGTPTLAGFAQTATVLGAALSAVPLSRLMARHGRRPGLAGGYAVGGVGSVVVILAAMVGSYALLLLGLLLFGAANAASLQARFAATDLAEPDRRSRSLAVVVWASTVGTVVGPNLTAPGSAVGTRIGLPPLAGSFLFAVTGFLVAVLLIQARLRPDPLLLSRGPANPADSGRRHVSIAASLRVIGASRPALLAVVAVAVAHTVMVAIMVMTPLHMRHGGADLRLVGLVISGHVAGMFALSPVVGWLADRLGRMPVIVLGVGTLGAALVLAGTAPAGHSPQLAIGLFLLGVGWSCGLVAGSTLLTESVAVRDRPAAQGVADLVMGLCGAVGGAASGVVVGAFGFGWLAVGMVPLLAVVLGMAYVARMGPGARPAIDG